MPDRFIQLLVGLDYTDQVAMKIEEYFNLLGFSDASICRQSPFEIYVGARK